MSSDLMASMLVDWMNPGGNNPTRRSMPETSTSMVCETRWRKRARSANRSGVLLLRVLARTKLRLEQALVRLRQRERRRIIGTFMSKTIDVIQHHTGPSKLTPAATVKTRLVARSGTFAIGSDLPVHRLGYGAMQLTGPGVWDEPTDRAQAIAVLRRAIELGINLIDTADSYGPY